MGWVKKIWFYGLSFKLEYNFVSVIEKKFKIFMPVGMLHYTIVGTFLENKILMFLGIFAKKSVIYQNSMMRCTRNHNYVHVVYDN